MHAISYQLKRAHLSALAIGRKIFRGTKDPADADYDGVVDMTPARFDLLYVVHARRARGRAGPCSIEMTQLRQALGLARATISKAVKRLAELGLVTCAFRPGGSRRNKIVSLTDEGVARVQRALHLVFAGGALARHYRRFIAKRYSGKPKNLPWLIAEELDRVWNDLQDLARHHFDKSSVLYDMRAGADH